MFDSVICMLGCIADNLESQSGVVKVSAVRIQMLEIVLKQKVVLGQALHRLQQEMFQVQFFASWQLLKLLGMK